ncbi:alcohol dehydrogenase catalytic domain-containing protein [Paenibacillus wulumuqiensis]|uniref:alcohol dehydrogenase catalytic domain-containing protein n=1 Tax=Paenibacillus wulumuqiensis TaxID=1567107 RepID=UPI0006191728|nr:alcohol dehydrogenase catalytic domain-containing protein [Paenibacillus wulumuqiensis]
MAEMKAVGLTRYLPIEQPDSLQDLRLPRPQASGHDLLVHVQAISVNPVDTKLRAPKDRIEPEPVIHGWDVAGMFEAVGEQVQGFKPGDQVYYAGSVTRPGPAARLASWCWQAGNRKPDSSGKAYE